MGRKQSEYLWLVSVSKFIIPLKFKLPYSNTAKYSGKKVDLGIYPGSVMNSSALGNLSNFSRTVSSIKNWSRQPREREGEKEREREKMSVVTTLVRIRMRSEFRFSDCQFSSPALAADWLLAPLVSSCSKIINYYMPSAMLDARNITVCSKRQYVTLVKPRLVGLGVGVP